MDNINPRIVEIIGPAGAGKTTLCQALSKCNRSISLSNFPDVRKISDAPFFIWYGLHISPTLFSLTRRDRRKLTRREFAWLSILYGWPDILYNELKKDKVIILDQGPVYLLAEAGEFGPESMLSPKAKTFWDRLYSRWAYTLELIIWLDAADADLQKRICTRDKEHVVKNESAEITSTFLNRYRRAYERTVSILLTNHPALPVLRFDTSLHPPEEIAGQLMKKFGLVS
jgi:deoxyadenosine/deoxycytidine kinase